MQWYSTLIDSSEHHFKKTTMNLILNFVILTSKIAFCFSFNDTTLFVVGGVSKIYLHQQPDSPLLDNFEILGCGSNIANLPSYPKPIFGVRSSLA